MVQVVRISSAATLLMAGVAMLLLPGPGLLTIGAALALLKRDVPAINRLLGGCPQPS